MLWIAVSKRLPKPYQTKSPFLVTRGNSVAVDYYNGDGTWYGDVELSDKVVAWMKMPTIDSGQTDWKDFLLEQPKNDLTKCLVIRQDTKLSNIAIWYSGCWVPAYSDVRYWSEFPKEYKL